MSGMKIPKVIFDVYCKLNDTNLIKLDLSVCENSRVEISIPIKITENLDNLIILMIFVIQRLQNMVQIYH